jgi:hypothetical protein
MNVLMKWISVNEKLPERSLAALVTDNVLVVPADWNADEKEFYVSRDDAGFLSERITHWMPFPKPPGGEKVG